MHYGSACGGLLRLHDGLRCHVDKPVTNTDCVLLIAKMRANRKITKPNNTSGSYVKPMGPQGPSLVEGYYGLLGRAPPLPRP